MKRRSIVGLTAACLALAALSTYALLLRKNDASEFSFANYESFLGFGSPNIEQANNDFVRLFPPGTPLDEIEGYFKKIGGNCYEWPEYKGQFICLYNHGIPSWSPITLIGRGWAVIIQFDEKARVSKAVSINSSLDGP